jgi:hypothetical protein
MTSAEVATTSPPRWRDRRIGTGIAVHHLGAFLDLFTVMYPQIQDVPGEGAGHD